MTVFPLDRVNRVNRVNLPRLQQSQTLVIPAHAGIQSGWRGVCNVGFPPSRE